MDIFKREPTDLRAEAASIARFTQARAIMANIIGSSVTTEQPRVVTKRYVDTDIPRRNRSINTPIVVLFDQDVHLGLVDPIDPESA